VSETNPVVSGAPAASTADLVSAFASSFGIGLKRRIQLAARHFDHAPALPGGGPRVLLGDDTAAIPDGDGHILFAAEGMLSSFLEEDPWFAGWCSVMTNVSDIAAMGGRPLAIVDVYWHNDASDAATVMDGIRAGSEAFDVPVVGGHTGYLPRGPHALAVAIIGRAAHGLLTSFGGRPGHTVLAAIDLRGTYRRGKPYWDAATSASPERLRGDLAVLVDLAERGWVAACKDVSMGGVIGTLLMMMEASRCGAVIDPGCVPRPEAESDLARWLQVFPSFGYLLAVEPGRAASVAALFERRGIACAPVATLDATSDLRLAGPGGSARVWDLTETPLTGFSGRGTP
jgi:uncharacterized protein